MKKLIINEPFEECDNYTKKVRLFAIHNNCLLVAKYAGIYMLPGGKIDQDEHEIEALKREVKEETGTTLETNKIVELINTIYYLTNYNSRNYKTPISKIADTKYFITEEDIPLNQHKELTENEKEGNFTLEYIELGELIYLLSNLENKKAKIHAKELLVVIEEYLKNTKLVDLHTHTIYSDGEHTPDEVIELAKNNNIKSLAITDHDTTLGLNHITNIKDPSIQIIPGIELTVKRDKGRMHILGLNIDYNNPNLIRLTEEIHCNNINNLKNIVNYLSVMNINLNQEDLDAIYNRTGNVGRPDIARLLIKEGYVKYVQEAFDKYLVEAFNKSRHLNKGHSYQDIIEAIKEAGGIPILAHPITLEMTKEEFEELLQDMIKCGLMGLETYHSNMSYEDSLYYMSLVEKYNLLYSVGSDYHGEHTKPDTLIGKGKNNLYRTDASVLRYINRLDK